MPPDAALRVIESLLKAGLLMLPMGFIAWWLITNWIEKNITFCEFLIGMGLLGGATLLGALSVMSGGWGFLGVIGIVYTVLLAFACWEYIYIKKVRMQDFLEDMQSYQLAIERDPLNAAAYSYLGRAYMKLGDYDQAVQLLEKAIELEPTSRYERTYLKEAYEGKLATQPKKNKK